jgi:hypothetical protein
MGGKLGSSAHTGGLFKVQLLQVPRIVTNVATCERDIQKGNCTRYTEKKMLRRIKIHPRKLRKIYFVE